MQETPKPTDQFYTWLVEMFDHFNQRLFGGQLPPVMLTVQRQKNTMGYFSAVRWQHRSGDRTHEIAVNPAYFANHSLMEICQTIVHEQCHLWQHEFGTPSRSGYHNKEWAGKMESLGLIPSDTGRPGGKKVGQQMSDYAAPSGPFIEAARELPTRGLDLSWVDLRPAPKAPCQDRELDADVEPVSPELGMILADCMPELVTDIQAGAAAKTKTKYQCGACAARVWGKPGLNLVCGDCDASFVVVD